MFADRVVRLSILCAVLAAPPCLMAQEEAPIVGRWGQGFGHIAGAEAKSETVIRAGAPVRSQAKHPVRLYIAKSPGSSIIIGADSEVVLHEERGEAEGRPYVDLIVVMNKGVVQIDLADRGPYRRLLLRGPASEVEVLGTLLTGERVSDQEDFIVLVRGLVRVRLRREVAAALNISAQDNGGIDLGPRQGVSGSTTTGLGPVQSLSARPQLAVAASQRKAIKDQATDTSDPAGNEASWGTDEAGAMLDGMVEDVGRTGNEGAAGGSGDEGGAEAKEGTGPLATGAGAGAAGASGSGSGPSGDPAVTKTGPSDVDPASSGSGGTGSSGGSTGTDTVSKDIDPADTGSKTDIDPSDPAKSDVDATPPEVDAIDPKEEVAKTDIEPVEVVEVEIPAEVIEEEIIEELAEAVTEEVIEDIIDDAVILDEVIESVTEAVEEVQELGGFPDPP